MHPYLCYRQRIYMSNGPIGALYHISCLSFSLFSKRIATTTTTIQLPWQLLVIDVHIPHICYVFARVFQLRLTEVNSSRTCICYMS